MNESEYYAWTCGWYRSEFKYQDADECYYAAKEFAANHTGIDKYDIRIWRRLTEEVFI